MFETIARSLRIKAMLVLIATALAALSLSAVGLVVLDLRAYEQQWSDDVQAQADLVARAAAPAMLFNDQAAATGDLEALKSRPVIASAALYDRQRRLFATYSRPGEPAPPHLTASSGYRIEGKSLLAFRPVIERGETLGTIVLKSDYDPWTHLREYLAVVFIVMALSLVIAALVSGWLQEGLTRPILEVAQVAREVMTRRDFSLRAKKTTEDEIGELVDSFNAMLEEAGKRAEQLREADRRKDEFLATLAHELRNPLAPLRNALEILRLRGDDPEISAKARDMMQRQLAQLVRLVDDLLDVSRITTGKLEIRRQVVELQAVIRNAVETARPLIDVQRHVLEVRLPTEPLRVEADSTRLAQVFSNLLNNAAKYTPPGGRIELEAEREHGTAIVRVRDTGIGIDPEVLPRIFDMFMQADRTLERTQAGLGVGLTLARRLVDLHGGTLSVASEGLGKGSEFKVSIPLADEPADALAPAAPAAEGKGGRHRVLLADDNVDFVASLAALLAARGHDVRVAHDGQEALEIANEFDPSFAFLDIGMPKVNGYDVARRLRAASRPPVLVAVTGWGQENDRRLAREAGFDRHLVKPVDPGQIEAILESY